MIKMQSFLGKVTIEGLHQMDIHINEWLARKGITPVYVKQSFGSDLHHDGRRQEPTIVITVWYEAEEEKSGDERAQ